MGIDWQFDTFLSAIIEWLIARVNALGASARISAPN